MMNSYNVYISTPDDTFIMLYRNAVLPAKYRIAKQVN